MASTHQGHIPLKNLSIQAKHAEIFPNLYSSLISIEQLCDNECIVTFYKHKVIVSKNKDIIIEGYRYPTNWLWRFLLHHPGPDQQTSKYSGATLMQPHWTNGATAPQSILPIVPARLSNFLPSDHLLNKQTLPDLGNQGWILLNMARTHREANFKVYPRIRDHSKRGPGPEETTTSGISRRKCNTFIHQGKGEHKWSTPPDIWSNWKLLFWPNWTISIAIKQR